jgi:hypothetical protein
MNQTLPSLTEEQRALVARPMADGSRFLEGPAGTGKTTVAVARLRYLLMQGVPASDILVLAPQRTLLRPYQQILRSADLPPGGMVETATVGGLARRMVDRFWPLVAERAGFAHPERPPIFLTLETAQYYMARIVAPFIQDGRFDQIAIDRNRLLSQILDNLNKAALNGFDYRQIGSRLRHAWAGAAAQAAVYDHAQTCANEFRTQCLANNLLDFSLQIEVFVQHLLTLPWPPSQGFMKRFTQYKHVIVENVEEDTPVAHDMLRGWLPDCESALVLFDHQAGYRVFLGADPVGGQDLRDLCRHRSEFHSSFVTTPHLERLGYEVARSLRQAPSPLEHDNGDARQALVVNRSPARFHPQMLDWVADEIATLVHTKGISPAQIVVVAPYLGDALRFALSERLSELQVPSRSHRPSRALRDEPAARCLLCLAALAHPHWGRAPLKADLAQALQLSIEGLDAVRAQLLTDIVYRRGSTQIRGDAYPGPIATQDARIPQAEDPAALLNPFTMLNESAQERIGYRIGNRYDRLRDWLYAAGSDGVRAQASSSNGVPSVDSRPVIPKRPDAPLDHFFGRLFGELLSQPGFGFHGDMEAGRIVAQLIESARKFRLTTGVPDAQNAADIAGEYLQLVDQGLIAAQYVPAWGLLDEEEAVLLAPAYTFLMYNRPVDYQFWLSVGSTGWWERLYQPLTHPYVLSRHWKAGDIWTDGHEVQAQTQVLLRLVLGLVRRCRAQIYLGISELGEQGYEQRGRLLQALQQALRSSR